MLDKIKYFTKLSSIAFLSFLKIFALGYLSSLLSLTIGLIILVYQLPLHAPHASGEIIGVLIFAMAPVQSILLCLIIISCYFIFTFSVSYAIKKIINRIIQDKAENTLYPLLDKVLMKFNKSKKLSIVKKGMDYSFIKLQLIDNVKNESENKWVKKALIYGFKKIKLEDVDFSQGNLDANEIIKFKTIQALKNVSKPSKKFFWYIIAFHWIIVLIILLMR